MTVSSVASKWSYDGDGFQTVFAYGNKIFAETDLVVILRDPEGVETLQIKDVDYTVSGVGLETYGDVTFMTPPLATDTVVIKIELPLLQDTVIPEQGLMPSEALENALDRGIKIAQQLSEKIDRAPLLPESSDLFPLAVPLPGSAAVPYYLRWNSGKTALEAVAEEVTCVEAGMVYARSYGSPGQTALHDADLLAAAAGHRLVITPGTWSITSDLILNANVKVQPGAIFSIAPGKVLTFAGTLEAGLYQIFSGEGTVNLGWTSVLAAHPEWWGAVADNATDCRDAIRAAIQCLETRGGGVLRLAALGQYVVTHGDTPGDPGVWVEGDNATGRIFIEGNFATINGGQCNGPIVRMGEAAASGPGDNYLFNCGIDHLIIAGAGSSAAVLAAYPYQDGLYVGNSQKMLFDNILITNIARNGLAGKKNTTGSNYRVWANNIIRNLKVSNCGNAGICLGKNNHDDADLQAIDDVTFINPVISGLGRAYSEPDSGYETTQAGVIILGYGVAVTGGEVASVYTTPAPAEKVGDGCFQLAGWNYGAGWSQDAANYEADASGASADLDKDLLDMENDDYTVAFAVRKYSAGTVTPYIGAIAGTPVSANGHYVQTITTGAAGTLALKFTGAGFTGSITDVRVQKARRGLNVGVYIRYARGLAINSIHFETVGSGQEDSRDLYLEDCSGAVNGYHTLVNSELHARYGVYCVNSGVVINGGYMNNDYGHAMANLVYFGGSGNKSMAMGLTRPATTAAFPPPHNGWAVGDSGPSIFNNMGIFPTSGGTYNGNIKFTFNDRYPSLSFRTGTTDKVKMFLDANYGDCYQDVTRKMVWRDISGNVKATLDLTTGFLCIGSATPTSPIQAPAVPIYANNAAALAGGLTAGAFYRTGADPDQVCVVH